MLSLLPLFLSDSNFLQLQSEFFDKHYVLLSMYMHLIQCPCNEHWFRIKVLVMFVFVSAADPCQSDWGRGTRVWCCHREDRPPQVWLPTLWADIHLGEWPGSSSDVTPHPNRGVSSVSYFCLLIELSFI